MFLDDNNFSAIKRRLPNATEADLKRAILSAANAGTINLSITTDGAPPRVNGSDVGGLVKGIMPHLSHVGLADGTAEPPRSSPASPATNPARRQPLKMDAAMHSALAEKLAKAMRRPVTTRQAEQALSAAIKAGDLQAGDGGLRLGLAPASIEQISTITMRYVATSSRFNLGGRA